jgi:hypothetical protein
MEKERILQMGSDKMIPRHVYDKPFTTRFPDRSEWKKGYQLDRNGGLIWFTDGSKTAKATGAGVCLQGTRTKLSFSFRRHTTIFQAEVYAIKACITQNIHRGYKNRNFANTRSLPNLSGTAANPLYNWPDRTGFNWYGCQIMRELLEMNLQIN